MSDLFAQMWAEVKGLEEFDWAEVARRGCSRETAVRYIRHWMDAGQIRVTRIARNGKRWYAPAHMPQPGPQPVTGEATPEGNMWRAMRHLRHFNPTDVAAHANAGGVEVTVEKARAYCRQLLASNHLKVRQTAIPGRREALYQIIEDTGPRAPKPVRLAGILDPNTGDFSPAKGGAA
ncbi:MAG: hypothetical protein VR71_10040 [Roseovarius sp. BRH_c41]|uniref:hypothetical protein n=1 Tax=Roseovarius sp. BRH_c41 TaxID=1629709 RepID=UPI0005F0C903|nr:hypothetical protein [Roseovarius sp. BRH_c41]KJS43528.1 MAG: hypothetical protein VR71_10040 [Roseovarius sp. BRH_c41]